MRAEFAAKEIAKKEIDSKELFLKELSRQVRRKKQNNLKRRQTQSNWARLVQNRKHIYSYHRQEVCRDPCHSVTRSEDPLKTFPFTHSKAPNFGGPRSQRKKNTKRAANRRLWRYFKSKLGKGRPEKAQETRRRRDQQLKTKTAFKHFRGQSKKPIDSNFREHKANGPKIPYGKPLKVATLNVRGLNGENGITKRQLIGDTMKKEGLDLMLLTETQVNSSSVEIHDDFTFFFSSDVQPGRTDREHAGVGIAIHRWLIPFLYEVKQTNGRLMAVRLRSHGINLAFLCCYAPHSGHTTEVKESFYESLQQLLNEFGDMVFLGGDFNARLQHRYNSEHEILGPHVFGRGRSYLEGVALATRENRDLFVDFCNANTLRVLNTDFQKPMSKQATFRENTTRIGETASPEKFAQLDFWLTKGQHKNSCLDVQSRMDLYMDTDHYILEMKVRVKLSTPQSLIDKKARRFSKPTDIQWQAYTHAVSRIYTTSLLSQDVAPWKQFNRAVSMAADECLSKDIPPRKRNYLSRSTWGLIKTRQSLYLQGNHDEVKSLDRKIKKEARADRKRHVVNQFQRNPQDPHGRQAWKSVNTLRKDFKPSYISMRNADGRLVPLKDRADTIATYLEQQHWSNSNGQGLLPYNDLIGEIPTCDNSLFSLQELHLILKRCKVNKQPGPDQVIVELYRWLNTSNRQFLLDILNEWWTEGLVPHDILTARVVPIYKKGNIDNPSNYRPISLLNSIYKVYASLILSRVQQAVEFKVSPTQYGFRPNKSTAHATFLIRRLQDWAEQKHAQFYLALIDWEKAFDKVLHDKLFASLTRLGLSQHFISAIKALYQSPTFYVQDEYGKSAVRCQNTGIRQGCPLSPYLFLLVMTCVDADVKRRCSNTVADARVQVFTSTQSFMPTIPYYSQPTLMPSTNFCIT